MHVFNSVNGRSVIEKYLKTNMVALLKTVCADTVAICINAKRAL